VPEPLPQVYAVGVGRVVGPDAGYQALSEPGFDFRSQVLLADGPELASPALVARIELHASPADRLRARVDFDAPGYLVVLQSFDPRWQASVDGQPAVLRRANVGFQALPVPAGRHDVELRYRPFAVVLGFGITALTLAAAAVVLASGGPARDAEQRHADREAHVP
jgi:hypothetical protein